MSIQGLYLNKKWSDCVFTIVDDDGEHHEYPIIKSIVAIQCPYFCSLFERHFEEKIKDVFNLENVAYNVFEYILKYLYGVPQTRVDNKLIVQIGKQADMWLIPDLYKQCDEFLKPLFSLDINTELSMCARIEFAFYSLSENYYSLEDLINQFLARTMFYWSVDTSLMKIAKSTLTTPARISNALQIDIANTTSNFPFMEVRNWLQDSKYLAANTFPDCEICRIPFTQKCEHCPGAEVKPCSILFLSCGHSYHTHCKDRWCRWRPVCPLCGTIIVIKDIIPPLLNT